MVAAVFCCPDALERDPDAIAAARASELRAAGRFSDAAIVEAKRTVARLARGELHAPAQAHRDVESEQAWWEAYRGRIRRFVCSIAWEDHLYSLARNGKIEAKGRQRDIEHVHSHQHVYPPGGPESLMLRCCRGHWVPPQAMLRPLLCARCLMARGLDGLPPLSESIGRCYSCGRARLGRPVAVARVPICLECDANAMSAGQIARAASAHRADRKVRDADMPTHFEGSGYRRGRRFRRNDPRTIGWFPEVDGVEVITPPGEGEGEADLAGTQADPLQEGYFSENPIA